MDGVPLEAWFIPADSDRLLVINHPMTCNRYGFPGHLHEYKGYFGGFEVNFLPELKALHDAGYNILTYDLRNCGRSGEGNGGISGLGLLECRDVVGSVRHARQHPVMGKLRTSLFSRCMGGNSTIIAMAKWPDEFRHIETLVLLASCPARPSSNAVPRIWGLTRPRRRSGLISGAARRPGSASSTSGRRTMAAV